MMFESDKDSDMRVVVLPPEPRKCAIATDAAAPSESGAIPVLELGRWVREKFLQPSKSALREAELVASFYEGVPFAKGREKHDEYLQRKLERSLQP